MKNVTKERDFIYRLPFACVCTLINKDALILNEDAFKHMHRTSHHKSVLTTLRHLLHLYNTISTSTTSTTHITSGQRRRETTGRRAYPDNKDETTGRQWQASVKVETAYKVRLRQGFVLLYILTML